MYRHGRSANAGEGVTDHVRPWHARNLCGICHRVGPREVKQSRLSSKMEDRLISGRLANAFLCLRSSPALSDRGTRRGPLFPRAADHLQPLITGPDTRPPMENPPFETHPRYISPIFLGGGSFLFWILEILGYKRSFFNPSCESSTRKFLCTFSKLIFLMKKDKLLCWKI